MSFLIFKVVTILTSLKACEDCVFFLFFWCVCSSYYLDIFGLCIKDYFGSILNNASNSIASIFVGCLLLMDQIWLFFFLLLAVVAGVLFSLCILF